jgi:putative nucleotidyltransferase with HDIG domain
MQKLPGEFQLLVITVTTIAAAFVWILGPQIPERDWFELLLFSALVSYATITPIPDLRGGYVTVTPVLLYVLLSVKGPVAALVAAGFGIPIGYAISIGWYPWRMVFNGAQIGISVCLAGFVFQMFGGSLASPGLTSFFVPFVLAAFAHQVSNNFFVALYMSRLKKLPLLFTWFSNIREFFWQNALSIPTGALLAVLYMAFSPLAILLYLGSLYFQKNATLLFLQQRKIHGQAIEALVLAMDADFPEGRGHSRRVADESVAIARKMNLSEPAIEAIELGALLHDIGMIGLGGNGLEGERLRDHVSIGASVVLQLPRRDVADIVLHHHDSFAASGPGLRGAQIPLGARIVAVAEAFDTMLVGGPPYKRKYSSGEAVEVLREGAGRYFDPQIVQAFLEVLKSESSESVAQLPGVPEQQPNAGT